MFKKYHKSFIKYFFVALCGLTVDYIVLLVSKEVLGLNYLVAATLGFIFGLLVNYFLSNKYVFSNAKIKSNSLNFVAFGTIGLVGLLILTALMWIQVDLFGLNYLIAKSVATVIVYFWNFIARAKLYHETA